MIWFFLNIIFVGFLERGYLYKDKIVKGILLNIGFLIYLVLMVVDILIYDFDVVFVGKD